MTTPAIETFGLTKFLQTLSRTAEGAAIFERRDIPIR